MAINVWWNKGLYQWTLCKLGRGWCPGWRVSCKLLSLSSTGPALSQWGSVHTLQCCLGPLLWTPALASLGTSPQICAHICSPSLRLGTSPLSHRRPYLYYTLPLHLVFRTVPRGLASDSWGRSELKTGVRCWQWHTACSYLSVKIKLTSVTNKQTQKRIFISHFDEFQNECTC